MHVNAVFVFHSLRWTVSSSGLGARTFARMEEMFSSRLCVVLAEEIKPEGENFPAEAEEKHLLMHLS